MKIREEKLVDRSTISDKNPHEAAILFLLLSPKISKNVKYSLKEGNTIFDYIFLLLEKRSSLVNQNPGDMAFPGGRVDSNDNNLIETAYREAEEEVGIDPKELSFIACMDEFLSSSQIIVRTVVSWLELDIPLKNFREEVEKKFAPLTDETEDTVVIPLSHCFNPKYYFSTIFHFTSDKNQRVGYIRYYDIDKYLKGTHIWGLTASMIRRFLDIVFPNNLLPDETTN